MRTIILDEPNDESLPYLLSHIARLKSTGVSSSSEDLQYLESLRDEYMKAKLNDGNHEQPSSTTVFSEEQMTIPITDESFAQVDYLDAFFPSFDCVCAADTTIDEYQRSETKETKVTNDENDKTVDAEEEAIELVALEQDNHPCGFDGSSLSERQTKTPAPKQERSHHGATCDSRKEVKTVPELPELSVWDVMAPDCGAFCCDPFHATAANE